MGEHLAACRPTTTCRRNGGTPTTSKAGSSEPWKSKQARSRISRAISELSGVVTFGKSDAGAPANAPWLTGTTLMLLEDALDSANEALGEINDAEQLGDDAGALEPGSMELADPRRPRVSHLRAVQTIEPLATKAELARLLEVSEDTIEAMVKAGMPTVRWGRRLVRFEPSRCLEWWREHGQDVAA
jgi:excisionase family DNA binding protein